MDKYNSIIQTENNKLGKFRYFEASFEIRDASSANQRNRNINFRNCPSAVKKIEELIDLGVLEESEETVCVFNFVLVKKYKGIRKDTKADRYLASKQQGADVQFRITCDMTSINAQLVNIPQVVLVRESDIRSKLKGMILSSVDLSDMFFAIPYAKHCR